MSMITASLWVPRGAAASTPTKYDIDEVELARISNLAKLHLEDAREDLEEAKTQGEDEGEGDSDHTDESEAKLSSGVNAMQSQSDKDNDLEAYDLEQYDSDGTEHRNGRNMPMFGNARALAFHDSNADDPYITSQEIEEEDEKEELQILATDNMLVAAKVEDEVAHLEVYVYEDEADNLYVHHDIMLPAIPLCLEWLDLPVGKDANAVDEFSRGNYVAVGTFDPDIELWDLDTIDSMYPNAILGQGATELKSGPEERLKVKKKKSKKVNSDHHIDAILSLAANKQHRNLLASSSADKTIKLWDLKTTKCAKSYSKHTDKVCSIAWNPQEATVLLSGSYDRTAVVADMRAPDVSVPRWKVESDVENVAWDPHNPKCFFVTTEDGIVHYNDIRKSPTHPESSEAIWKLQAHDESVSAFDVNPIIPGFLATGSNDKQVKLWNIQPNGPSIVVARTLDVGKVFSTRFAPDAEVGFRLAVAGSKGVMQIWDTSTNAAVRHAFATRLSGAPIDKENEKIERIIGIGEDSSDSEEEGGPEPGGDVPVAARNGWESMEEDEG